MAAAAAAKLGVPSAPSDCGPATAAGQGGSERSETTSEVKLSNGSGKKRKAGGEAEAGGEGGSKKKKKKAAGKKAKGTSSEQECGQQQPAEAQQQQQQQPPPKKARIVIEPVVASCGPTYEFVPTPTTGELPVAATAMMVMLGPVGGAALPDSVWQHLLHPCSLAGCFRPLTAPAPCSPARLVGREAVCVGRLPGRPRQGCSRGAEAAGHV
jgi:hypothetical protein